MDEFDPSSSQIMEYESLDIDIVDNLEYFHFETDSTGLDHRLYLLANINLISTQDDTRKNQVSEDNSRTPCT